MALEQRPPHPVHQRGSAAPAQPMAPLASASAPRFSSAIAGIPPEIEAAAEQVLAARGAHPDVVKCIDTAVGYRTLLPLPQVTWLVAQLASDRNHESLNDVPAIPLALPKVMQLLATGGAPPARRALHNLALAGLALAGLALNRDFAGVIAKADMTTLETLARFAHFVPGYALTRLINATLSAKRSALRAEVVSRVSPAVAKALNDRFDIGSMSPLHATPPSSVPADELARSYVTRGKVILASGGSMEALRAGLLARSTLNHDQALCLGNVIDQQMGDGFLRSAIITPLTEVLRLTSGEVLPTCTAIRQREPNARPDTTGHLSRADNVKDQASFPLRHGDSYFAELLVGPYDGFELFHEMGHVLECTHPDVLRAALAFRDALAIGGPRSLNDLNVIYRIAPDAATQRAMLERVRATRMPALTDAQVIHHVFDELGLSARIDAVIASVSWNELRPYVPSEMAYPVVGDPYVGATKPLVGTTEVVSLGLEALASADRMRELRAARPEHLAFIIGALEALRPSVR